MTYRNYRNSLHKQMLSYLRFMKCADTDDQLLELHTEVNELRTKIHNLDQMTASEMLVTVEFTESTYESYGFPSIVIPEFEKKSLFSNKKSSLRGVSKEKPKYVGVSWNKGVGKYCGSLMYKGKTFLKANFDTPEEAVKQRDLAIIKYHLPLDLQILKKDTK